MRINVLGIRFHDVTKDDVKKLIESHMDSGPLLTIVTPNPEIVMAAQDSELQCLVNGAGLVLKDGVGIKWAEKLKGIQGKPRVTGIDTLHMILKQLDEAGRSLYLVGSKEEVLHKAATQIQEIYPHIQILGMHHGYFAANSSEENKILSEIEEKSPHAVVAAMGFPKQEQFMARLPSHLHGVALGCGGSLDVLSGNTKRAPHWMQRWGLEWLYRLFQEPSRWKRQLQIPRFLFKIIGKKNSCFIEED